MEKTQFQKQAYFLLISVIIFALICGLAFWPQSQTLKTEKKVLGTTTATTNSAATTNTEKTTEVDAQDNSTNNLATEGTSPMSEELIITDTQVGTGAEVKAGDMVRIHYTGTLEDGTIFDSSVNRGQPFETQIGVGMLIQGWDQGIPGMKVGGKRHLIIPAELGYGAQAVGSIPANSTLIFDVELLEIL